MKKIFRIFSIYKKTLDYTCEDNCYGSWNKRVCK